MNTKVRIPSSEKRVRAPRRPILRRAGDAEIIFVGSIVTNLGRVFAAATAERVVAVSLPGEPEAAVRGRLVREWKNCEIRAAGSPLLARALEQLQQFFDGRRRRFDLPLDPRVTPFARRVLDALAAVPFGATLTYGQLAARVGSPGAARAVGTALSKNPIPIILPCHRIVASTGIGGFAGKAKAVDVKRKLLNHESADNGTGKL